MDYDPDKLHEMLSGDSLVMYQRALRECAALPTEQLALLGIIMATACSSHPLWDLLEFLMVNYFRATADRRVPEYEGRILELVREMFGDESAMPHRIVLPDLLPEEGAVQPEPQGTDWQQFLKQVQPDEFRDSAQ